MNKTTAPEYLSLKRIVIVSLIICFAFHLIMVLSFFFHDSLFASRVGDIPPSPFSLLKFLSFTLMNSIMVFLILVYNRKVLSLSIKNKYIEQIIIVLGSLIITIVLCFGIIFGTIGQRQTDKEVLFSIIRDSIVRDLILTIVTLLVVQFLKSQYYQKTIAVENEMLRSENIRTHYEALKSQLDPHFLFNSMNTLQSLIELDKEKAGDYVQQLSSVLRYTLQNKEVVTLADEMKCVEAYCAMMQIRYGKNLNFDFQVDKKYNTEKVLPLAVQSLVENAIKHNVISDRQPFVVHVSMEDGKALRVSNPIQPKIKEERGEGIGLANLVERYRLQWNKEVIIKNDGKTFEVTLPLIKQ